MPDAGEPDWKEAIVFHCPCCGRDGYRTVDLNVEPMTRACRTCKFTWTADEDWKHMRLVQYRRFVSAADLHDAAVRVWAS